jgi:hypothetical protein
VNPDVHHRRSDFLNDLHYRLGIGVQQFTIAGRGLNRRTGLPGCGGTQGAKDCRVPAAFKFDWKLHIFIWG